MEGQAHRDNICHPELAEGRVHHDNPCHPEQLAMSEVEWKDRLTN
jgi:hypothetical protein